MHAYRDQYAQLFRDGQDVILVAISSDPVDALAAWARDDQFQFLMASDSGSVVARAYGGRTGRNVFVVGPDGTIAYRAAPFREIDPQAYTELGEALGRVVGERE